MTKIFALCSVIGLCPISASPIQEVIDTHKLLKSVGVELISERHGAGNADETIDFKVTWSPKVKDKSFAPRLDLIVLEPGAFYPLIQIRYQMNEKGSCSADFSLAKDKVPTAELWFRNSQQTEYVLRLADYVAGFPRTLTDDPFTTPKNAEQPGAGQPAAKPADKVPANDKPSPPTSKDAPR